MSKNLKFKGRKKIVLGCLLASLIAYGAVPGSLKNLANAGFSFDKKGLAQESSERQAGPKDNSESNLLTVQENSLLPVSNMASGEEKVVRRINILLTAYSSSPRETDDTPYITASGAYVREGIAANNLLPFGTRFRIPEIFGGKVFVVEDRLSPRKGYYHVDIWYPSRQEALSFGKKWTYIEIL